MRLVSFLSIMALAFSATAQNGYHPKKGSPTYVESEGTIGYIGNENDIQSGDYVTEGYVDQETGTIAYPAPPDYNNGTYERPQTYPEFSYQKYQETYVAPQPETVDEVYERAYEATNGACDTKKNPHSYACTDWNFQGNGTFPLFKMDWWNVMQGPWFAVTYVRPDASEKACRNGMQVKGENRDCEFSMKKNPDRPSQPMGMINSKTKDLVGQVYVNGDQMIWENWLGRTLSTSPESFQQVDDYTVQMVAYEGDYAHLFVCRDFNRNSNHHFLCKWYMKFPNKDRWVERGFMGMLTQEVWDGFIRGH